MFVVLGLTAFLSGVSLHDIVVDARVVLVFDTIASALSAGSAIAEVAC